MKVLYEVGKFVRFQSLWSTNCDKQLIKKFLNKGWRLWDWIKFWKSCKRLVWRQDEAAAWKAYRISFVVLLCNIHT